MQLTEKQRRHLKGLAHPLKPVILMGHAGLTDAVVAETARALADHELIKVRLPGLDREAARCRAAGACGAHRQRMVTRIGHVAVLYRPREPLPRIVLSGLERRSLPVANMPTRDQRAVRPVSSLSRAA